MPVGELLNANERFRSLFSLIGKQGLNALFPNDFEFYLCALELVNSKGDTIEYFIFPVMPSSIDETKTEITNIRKTATGITAISTASFIPRDITIAGNFGRWFKILVGGEFLNFSGVRFSTRNGIFTKQNLNSLIQIKKAVFDPRIKTGYGCIKVMEAILNKAGTVDELNNPYKLYFYNQSLGNNYLIKPVSFTFSQSEDANMIWNYTLQMKAIAPLEQLVDFGRGSLVRNLGFDFVQRQANGLLSNLRSTVRF